MYDSKEERAAFEEGHQAGRTSNVWPIWSDIPYSSGSKEYKAWEAGWTQATGEKEAWVRNKHSKQKKDKVRGNGKRFDKSKFDNWNKNDE